MSKVIIARLFNNVKRNVEIAETLITATQRPGRDSLMRLEQAHQVQASLNSLINGSLLSYHDVMWEHEGGDPTLATKLLPSAMRTAYTAAYHAWCRENGLYDDFRETPADHAAKLAIEEASGLNHEGLEHEPYEVLIEAAMAVYSRGHHVANYKDGEFKWMLSMDLDRDGEKVTVRTIVPISEWALMQAEESHNAKRAEFMRLFSEAVKDDWHHMPIDLAEAIMKVWLDEIVIDNDSHTSRRQRIVERVADRVFDEVQLGIMSNDPKRTLKAFKHWELLLASPKLAKCMTDYKASREYKLEYMAEMAEKLQAAIAEKEEKLRLDALESKIAALLDSLTGSPSEPEPAKEAQEPVKVTELPAGPGPDQPMSMEQLAWKSRLDEIKRRNGKVITH